MEENHLCFYCGEKAHFQLKNGNWCCKENARSCPFIKKKVSEKAKEKWKQLKEQGIKYRKDIPENLRKNKKDFGEEGVCFYCGQEAKYQLKNGRWCCSEKFSSCPEIKRKNSEKRKEQCLSGNYKNNLQNYIETHIPWNKGLTKETDERLKKISDISKRRYANEEIKSYWKGKHHSIETRDKLSKLRTQYLDECKAGFQDVGWYRIKNINNEEYIVRGTWERDFGNFLTENNILWIKKITIEYKQEDGSIHRYVPDFFIPSINLYVEVKGYFSEFDKKKMKLIIEQNNINVRYIFQEDIDKIKNKTFVL